MTDIKLDKAGRNDADIISELARRIWNDHYLPIIGQDQVNYMLALMYSPAALHQQMEDGHVFFLVREKEKPVGYISLSTKESSRYFLHKFYIETNDQRKGIGTDVFHKTTALFPGMREMRLTVNRKNFKSVNFYFKLGFRIEEVKDFDIGGGYLMEDFIMVKYF
ncbi:MAG: acetyltransferase family protein [Bacteroidetes bacterium]|nr:MAG: acetyltransferase family protein [Bacteroidota bacterium]